MSVTVRLAGSLLEMEAAIQETTNAVGCRLTEQALGRSYTDAAASNWAFLEQHTERQLIDFFHATEYIAKLAQARFPQRSAEA